MEGKILNLFNIFKKPVSHMDTILKKTVGFMENVGYRKAIILGSGSNGNIFTHKCTNRKENVRVKVETTWEMESSLWPNFEHRNILPLHSSFKMDDFELTLIPKSMDAILMKSSFKQQPADLLLCLKLLPDGVSGVQYLQSRDVYVQICHFDINDDNILVTSDMKTVLGDFSCVNTSKELVKRFVDFRNDSRPQKISYVLFKRVKIWPII